MRGYGQRFGFARHLFARVREPRAARAFLAALADPVTTEQEWARHPDDDAQRRALPPRARGARAAGVDPRRLPARAARGHGGARRTPRRRPRARGTTSCATSRSSSSSTPRARTRSRPRRGAGSARCARQGSGLELAHAQPAALLGQQREHFGFTDGFSQPAIEGVAREDVRGQGIPYKRAPWWPLSRTRWRAVKPGEFVLGYEDEDRGPAPAPPAPFDRNASYMVWRKLHQDVGGFRAQLAEQARRLELDEELVAAKLVGRWRDGSPLVLRPDGPDPALGNDKRRANDFRYGDDPLGLRCPRGAHVRRANPRDALGWEGRLTARHRILRRGMPYGPALPDGAAGRRRGARAALRLPAGLDRAPVRDRPVAVVQRRQRVRPGPRGRPDHRPRRRRGAPHHRGRPAARGLAAAQLRRVPRRRVPRRPGHQRPAGAACALTRAGHSAPACDEQTPARLERVGTPFHAKSRPRVRPTLESQLP